MASFAELVSMIKEAATYPGASTIQEMLAHIRSKAFAAAKSRGSKKITAVDLTPAQTAQLKNIKGFYAGGGKPTDVAGVLGGKTVGTKAPAEIAPGITAATPEVVQPEVSPMVRSMFQSGNTPAQRAAAAQAQAVKQRATRPSGAGMTIAGVRVPKT